MHFIINKFLNKLLWVVRMQYMKVIFLAHKLIHFWKIKIFICSIDMLIRLHNILTQQLNWQPLVAKVQSKVNTLNGIIHHYYYYFIHAFQIALRPDVGSVFDFHLHPFSLCPHWPSVVIMTFSATFLPYFLNLRYRVGVCSVRRSQGEAPRWASCQVHLCCCFSFSRPSRTVAHSPKYSPNHQWRTCGCNQRLIEAWHIFALLSRFHFFFLAF